MSNLIIQRKSRLDFDFNVLEESTCSTNSNQYYQLSYTPSGTANNVECFTSGRYQNLTYGTHSQNTNWGGYINAFWQQHRWASDCLYPYGSYGVPKVYADGCVLNSTCISEHPHENLYAKPKIDVTTVLSTSTLLRLQFDWTGTLKLPYETTMGLWEEINGTWVLLASTTCPDGVDSLSGHYNPSIQVNYTASDVGVHHYKCTFETNDPNPSFGNYSGFADMYIIIGSNNYDLPNIYTSEHSFVSFTPQSSNTCSYNRATCLPIADENDVQFQMYLDVSTGGQYGNFPHPILGNGVDEGTQLFLCVCDNCQIPEEITHSADFNSSVAKLNEWVRVPDTEIYVNGTIYWHELWNYILATIPVGECFNICLCKREPAEGVPGEWIDTVLQCIPQCFIRIEDECYTTVLQFRSNNDELCFYYTQDPNYFQSIRLPMYFRDVQYPSASTGYQKSDGTWVKLSERIQEEWTLTTDWMEIQMHKALKFALSHDTVIALGNMGINDQITAQNNYTINWESKTKPYPLAKGTVKVNKTINTCSVNTNC